jgi:DNA-binding MarR family transcriptional regulator
MNKSIGLELRSLNNLVMRYIENLPHRKQVESITGTNGWIIGFLADHSSQDIYQRDLEQKFSITRSTTSKVLNLMEQKGLIERQSVACDARLKKIVLTEKAWEISEWMKEDADFVESSLTQGFSEEELLHFRGYIERMKKNIKMH